MKKGFTLIELLAVIVILAVLALIATPIVLNIIDDSKKNATLRSSENYIKAIEFSIAKSVMENKRLPDGTYSIMTNGNICLGTLTGSTCDDELIVEVSGETPESGTVTIKSRKIDSYEFTYASGFVVVDGEIKEDSGDSNLTLAQFILKQAKDNNYYYTTTPDFSKVTADGEYGLYQAPDGLGTSYYFRGDTENNYVQFGYLVENVSEVDYYYYRWYFEECYEDDETERYCWDEWVEDDNKYDTLEQCNEALETGDYEGGECNEVYKQVPKKTTIPMYWRIVRVNGDNSIRLVFAGIEKVHNGQSNTSSINEFVDYWENFYLDYLTETGFCHGNEIYSDELWDEDNDFHSYIFEPYNRLVYNKEPSLICEENGTGKTGELSADEVAMAGGVYRIPNNTYYLYNNEAFATGSLTKHDTDLGGPDFFAVLEDGSIDEVNYGGESATAAEESVDASRLVINLKADVSFTGDGSYDNPYVIETD